MRACLIQSTRPICAFLMFAVWGSAAVRRVGPEQQYATPCRAAAEAAAGDTIQIDAAGNYDGDVCSWTTNGLTIVGVNGRPKIDAMGQSFRGRATWMISGNDTTVENIELTGARGPYNNGAAIWQMGTNLTVRKCYIHGNEDGILAGDNPSSHILIETTEFADNGYSDGQSHNIYINHIAEFTLRFSYSHDSISGHLVKSRAVKNFILYNRLTGETGTSSFELDLPNGGLSYVIGNTIEQGALTENSTIVAYGLEGLTNPDSNLYFVNNTVVNDRYNGFFIKVAPYAPPVLVQNNIFSGPGLTINQLDARVLNNRKSGAIFVDSGEYDYHLRPGSMGRDAGSNPGTVNGYSLTPKFQYVHPTCFETRTTVGAAIDVGAFEIGGGGGVDASCAEPTGLSKLTLSAARIDGGQDAKGTLRLSGPAPEGGLSVNLSSSDASVASIPESITIPRGELSGQFKIRTTKVISSTPIDISASLGTTTKLATLDVDPASTAILSLTLSANSTDGGKTITGRVTLLNPSSTSAMSIILMCIPPDVAEVASSITVPAGSSTATFPIKLAKVKVSTRVQVGAVYNSVTKLASLTVTPQKP
jgi:hypothetical protein